MQMRFLPDEPIGDPVADLLGLGAFVELVAGSLERAYTPYVFGILGDWGTGKTSILQLLEYQLAARREEHAHLVTIPFDSWLYENEANVMYPLLDTIRRHHEKHVAPKIDREAFKTSFLKVVGASALALTDVSLRTVTKQAFGEAVKLDDLAGHLERVDQDPRVIDRVLRSWTDEVRNLRSAFAEMVERYAEDYGQAHGVDPADVRLVLLIDDLDRCLPDTALGLLEKIKHFLAVPGCLYVLGLNPEVVYQGVRIKYRGLELDGREYLEKILNYAFHVPEPEPTRVRDFARRRLSDLLLVEEDRERFEAHFNTFGTVLEACRFTNPRKIKRILNRYLLFLGKFEKDLPSYDMRNVVRLVILAEYYPAIFRLLLNRPESLDSLKRLTAADFDVAAFENRFGTALAPVYGELTRMRDLFQLIQALPASDTFRLERQVADVFSIARLP